MNSRVSPQAETYIRDGSGKIKRSDFGMSRGIPSIGDELVLTVAFEGNKD